MVKRSDQNDEGPCFVDDQGEKLTGVQYEEATILRSISRYVGAALLAHEPVCGFRIAPVIVEDAIGILTGGTVYVHHPSDPEEETRYRYAVRFDEPGSKKPVLHVITFSDEDMGKQEALGDARKSFKGTSEEDKVKMYSFAFDLVLDAIKTYDMEVNS